ncbi:hypothetical protein NSND_60037 [Nitrospira sp. ND1]|nr:hypothetical protein NSND_60037 [Nitrospira sp. ND1]
MGFEAGQFTAAVKSRHDAAGIRRMGRIVSIQIPAVSPPIRVVHDYLYLRRALLLPRDLPPGLRASLGMVTQSGNDGIETYWHMYRNPDDRPRAIAHSTTIRRRYRHGSCSTESCSRNRRPSGDARHRNQP